jgi:multiple sugar transport system permease protein
MRQAKWQRPVCIAIALLLAVIMLFPVYWMIMTALLPVGEILSRDPPLLPHPAEISFDAFTAVLKRRPFLLWTANSLIVGIASSAVSLVAASLAGYALSRFKFRGVRFAGVALLLGKLAPPSLIIIPLFIMFSVSGLLDGYFGLILAHVSTGVPLATWLMKGFFDRIPREIEQAAMIDGCTRLGALRHVILPLTRPGLASCFVYLLLVSWSEFIFGRTLMTSPTHRVLTVGLQGFSGEYQVDWAGLMAAGTLTLVPIVVLFVVLEPFLVSGMTKGALAN